MTMLTLGRLIERASKTRGGHDAYVELDRRRTWSEIHVRTDALGIAMKRLGVRIGSRVGIISKDSIEVAETIIACAKIGAVRVGLNPRLAPPELAALIDDSGIELLFVQGNLERLAREAVSQALKKPGLIGFAFKHDFPIEYENLIAEVQSEAPLEQTPHDTIMICYTTGSTGLPKGAIFPHLKMVESMAAIALCEGARPDDVWFHAMPAPGIPVMHMLRNVFHGSKCAILGEWDSEKALRLIEQERCTITVLVPTMLSDLLGSGLIPKYDCSSMRQLGYGSAMLPPATLRQAMKAFACEFLQMYGITELMGMGMMLTPADHERALREGHPCLESAGRPLYYIDACIVDEDGNELGRNETGELLLRTDFIVPGYWNQDLKYAETVRDGWLHTGDIASIDDEGFVYLKDRAKFRIKSGGYNIYPTEIENCLAEHPAVLEVSVFGLPDPKWGDRIEAVVSLHRGKQADTETLREFCRGKIADFKVPKIIRIWDSLPKGPTGKIQKREIIDICLREPSVMKKAGE